MLLLKRERTHVLMYSLRVSGGAGLNFCRIANALSESGYRVTVVCSVIEEKYSAMLKADVKVIKRAVKTSWLILFRLAAILKRERPDLLFANIGLNAVVCWLSMLFSGCFSKFVIREVNSPTLFIKERKGNFIKQRLIGMAYKYSDLIVSLTSEMKKDLVANWGVDEEKIIVIPNGVNLPPCASASKAEGTNQKVLLNVGRLERQKNQTLLLEVFAIVARDVDAKLVILGDGSERNRLLMHADSLGILPRVEFLGHVEDTAPYYQVADLLILTSFYEGFPNVLLESLAWGVPVVSVNCLTGPKDIVANEDYGFLVDSYDPVILAGYIKKALEKSYDKLTLRLRAEEFSEDKQKSSFVSAIDRIVFGL